MGECVSDASESTDEAEGREGEEAEREVREEEEAFREVLEEEKEELVCANLFNDSSTCDIRNDD